MEKMFERRSRWRLGMWRVYIIQSVTIKHIRGFTEYRIIAKQEI